MESNFIKSVKLITAEDSNEVYHGNKDYISASGLKLMKKSPAHFKEMQVEETDAMRIGSAYHTLILEPEKFEQEYFIFDDRHIIEVLIGEGAKKPKATNQYKQWEENQYTYADGKTIISWDDFEVINNMKKVLFRHPYAKSLLTNGIPEQSMYFEVINEFDQQINVKIRPDYIKEKKRIIVDLKTTSDASVDGFQKNAASYDYQIQAALYADLIEKSKGDDIPWTFIFIAQEKKAPYAFNLFEASPQFIAHGRYEYEMLLMLYKHCLDTGKWQGYQVFCENKFGINELNLPAWAIREINWFNH